MYGNEHRKEKEMKKAIIIGICGLTLVGLFFLAKHETHISREFVTADYIKPILW